jgi:hypothetical protein
VHVTSPELELWSELELSISELELVGAFSLELEFCSELELAGTLSLEEDSKLLLELGALASDELLVW